LLLMKRGRNKQKKPNNQLNVVGTSKANSVSLHRDAIMPFSIMREISYVDSTVARNNPGNSYLVTGIRINDPYDPDPAILSGSISGFKELMQFYNNYRVVSNTVDVTIANQESFPLIWGLVFSQTNILSLISTSAAALNVLENGYSTGARTISGKGGLDRDTQVCKIPLKDLVGNAQLYSGDTQYTGTVTSSPAISLWCFLIVVSGSGAALTNGFVFNSKYTYNTKFFNRILLNA